jgi:hypothetical protein
MPVAARRLLILLLVLLGISTLAAALAPVRSSKDKTTSETTTTSTASSPAQTAPAAAQAPAPAAGLFRVTIAADPKKISRVVLYVGEELQLTVNSGLFDQIAIPELGEVEPVSPDGPAQFDLLLVRAGDYAVRLVDARKKVAVLEVNPGARPENRKKAGG